MGFVPTHDQPMPGSSTAPPQFHFGTGLIPGQSATSTAGADIGTNPSAPGAAHVQVAGGNSWR